MCIQVTSRFPVVCQSNDRFCQSSQAIPAFLQQIRPLVTNLNMTWKVVAVVGRSVHVLLLTPPRVQPVMSPLRLSPFHNCTQILWNISPSCTPLGLNDQESGIHLIFPSFQCKLLNGGSRKKIPSSPPWHPSSPHWRFCSHPTWHYQELLVLSPSVKAGELEACLKSQFNAR